MASADSSPASAARARGPSMTSLHGRRRLVRGEVLVAHELLDQGGRTSQIQKVPQDAAPFVGQDRLGMKLHAVHRVGAVPHAMMVPSSFVRAATSSSSGTCSFEIISE